MLSFDKGEKTHLKKKLYTQCKKIRKLHKIIPNFFFFSFHQEYFITLYQHQLHLLHMG